MLEKTTDTIILEKYYFKKGLYTSGRIECTENCAFMHIFLCIQRPENEDQGLENQKSEIRGRTSGSIGWSNTNLPVYPDFLASP